MTTQEYTKQVAIAFDVWLNGYEPEDDTSVTYNQFVKSESFKSIPQPEASIPVSKIQKRIDSLKSKPFPIIHNDWIIHKVPFL